MRPFTEKVLEKMMASGLDIEVKDWMGRSSFLLRGVATLMIEDFKNRWTLIINDSSGCYGQGYHSIFGEETEEEALCSLEGAIIEAKIRGL